MRILHISDIHCSYAYLEKMLGISSKLDVDVIVVSGDFECDYDIIGMLVKQPIPVLAVPGNMDDHYIARLLREQGIAIDAQCRQIEEYYFTGISGLEVYTSMRKAEEYLKKYREKSILVTHHPPRASKIDITWGNVHAGLPDITRLIKEYKPRACLCGHIHEARGYEVIDKTLCVNPGPLALGYYAVIDLEKNKVFLEEL